MDGVAGPRPYPIWLEIDYPAAQSRWKALLRLPLAVPVLIFSYFLQANVVVAIWAAVLVRGRIPRWLFDIQVSVNRWAARAAGYLLLLTDVYPAFEGEYPVRYDAAYPERLSRWRVLAWKLITSLTHVIVLALLNVTLLAVVPIAWFAILFSGRFPKSLHGYVAGIMRWGARVQAYLISLTDEFPPFSLSADAGPGGRGSYRMASAVGLLAVGIAVSGFVAVFVILATGSQHIETEVSYERLVSGELERGEGRAEVHSGQIDLVRAVDPADDRYGFLRAEPSARLVEFRLRVLNWRGAGEEVPIRASRFTLVDTNGAELAALLVTGDGMLIGPFDIGSGEVADVAVLFELPASTDPAELQYDVLEYVGPFGEQIDWQFR